MQCIFEHMSVCWWLPDVFALEQPTRAHEDALYSLYMLVKPDLERRPFPPASFQMSPEARFWPNLRSSMIRMYRRWWSLVHRAGNRPESKYRS